MATHPRFCEKIRRGSRKGTFLIRHGQVQYSVLWDDERLPQWVPAVGIEKCGVINTDVLTRLATEVQKNISSKVNIRRRGGLRRGVQKVVGPNKGGTQGRTGSPDDPRTMHKPVEDEASKGAVA